MLDRRNFLKILVTGTSGLAAIGIMGCATQFNKSPQTTPVSRRSDEPEERGASTAKNYFSADYQEARMKFLEACGQAGARVESLQNPQTGPDGRALYTDVAVLGPEDAKSILVLGSGTHGVEGFCGSGIQNGLLREGIGSWLKPEMSVVMIHAINPYGFAHLRRFNEDNIDLNRNFVDHSKAYPPNPHYEALADAIAPEKYSKEAAEAAGKRLKAYAKEHGQEALQSAISGGQYTHPKGLFFGGHSQTWSNKTIRTIARQYLTSAARLAFVDFHTGLGPHGYGEIILNNPKSSPPYERAVAWWGNRVKTTKTGEAVSADLTGVIKLAFFEMLPKAEITSVSLEFGTVPLEEVFAALQAENWWRHHGGKDHPLAKKIENDLRRAFYPDTDDWKTLVWEQGKEVARQAIAGLSS